jgi:hypothetical protein
VRPDPPIVAHVMDDLEQLVRRTVAGDRDAWQALQAALDPMIETIARRHSELRGKGLAALPDDVAEVKLASLERLARADFQNLKRFLDRRAADPEPSDSFDAWVYGAVDFAIREHLRKRYGRAPKLAASESPSRQLSKRELHSQAVRLDDLEIERSFLNTIGMTARLTVAQIFKHIDHDFTADEARVMHLYYEEDRGFDEIARLLGLTDDKSVERMVRRLNGRLRYRFAANVE